MKKLGLVIVITILLTTLFSEGVIPEGQGTSENPYLIESLDNLEYISEHSNMWNNKYFLQTSDIDATETQNWNGGMGFKGLGSVEYVCWDEYHDEWGYEFEPFNSHYDGGGFSITNLFQDKLNYGDSEPSFAGFVSSMNSGQLVNINLVNIDITGFNETGGLCGHSEADIDNCSVSGSVNGAGDTGLLVGRAYSMRITNCRTSGSAMSNYAYVAGICGYARYIDMINCHSSAEITGQNWAGGIAGAIVTVTMEKCSFLGSIECDESNCGVFHAGIHREYLASLPLVITNSFYDYSNVTLNNQHIHEVGALSTQQYQTWLDNDKQFNLDDYFESNGDDYYINSVDDFRNINLFYNGIRTFVLNTDLDVTGEEDLYIPYYSGDFNGNDFSISNYSLSRDSKNTGLIGHAENGQIENINLVNCNISGTYNVGGLVAFSAGTIENCYVTGQVTGTENVGLVSGFNIDGMIANCHASGNVSGVINVGGMVGKGYAKQSKCNCSVSGEENIGGMIGIGIAEDCYSESVVVGENYVGGLIGYADHINWVYGLLDVVRCGANCNVTGATNVGGLIGKANNIEIYDSYSKGQLSLLDNYNGIPNNFGGLIGDCFSTYVWRGYSIVNINIGTEIEEQGELIGLFDEEYDFSLSEYFYIPAYSGVEANGFGTSIDISQLTDINFLNLHTWDTEQVWGINSSINDGFPYILGAEPVPNSSEEDNVQSVQSITSLKNSYPNPFNPETTIQFNVATNDVASLTIYNVKGQIVKSFESYGAGQHSVVWNGTNSNNKRVSSGLYLYRLKGKNNSTTKKMMLLK